MSSESPSTAFVEQGDNLNDFLRSFWQRQVDAAEKETPDFRHPALPLARIKKVMKNDPDVKVSVFNIPCHLMIKNISCFEDDCC